MYYYYLLYNRWMSEHASVALSLATQLSLFFGSSVFRPIFIHVFVLLPLTGTSSASIHVCSSWTRQAISARLSCNMSRLLSEVTFVYVLYILHVPSLRCLTVFIPFCLKSYLDCVGKNAKNLEASWRYAFNIQKQRLPQYSQQFGDWF